MFLSQTKFSSYHFCLQLEVLHNSSFLPFIRYDVIIPVPFICCFIVWIGFRYTLYVPISGKGIVQYMFDKKNVFYDACKYSCVKYGNKLDFNWFELKWRIWYAPIQFDFIIRIMAHIKTEMYLVWVILYIFIFFMVYFVQCFHLGDNCIYGDVAGWQVMMLI